MDKKILRKSLLDIRREIPDKKIKSTIIVNKIIQMDKYINANVVALYKALKNEVNLDYLINYSLNRGKIVLLPRVVGDNLVFIKINSDTKYDISNFGVMEPMYDISNLYTDKIDLIIVPGVGFDKNNNRIGYGKGYYDRYLFNKSIYKVGVCFKEQLIDNIPIDDNDIKMDSVIDDK